PAGLLLDDREQRPVLLAVAQRFEAGDGRLRRAVEVEEAKPQSALALGPARAHADPCGAAGPARRGSFLDARPRIGQPDAVGVRIEHDDAEVGLQQQLLEDDAEAVRLARAGL